MNNDNPFSDPSMPSLEWIRDTIAARYDIPHQRRMDMVSACNKVAEWFDLPLSLIPASAVFLRDRFKNFHPAHAGVTKRRVGNVRSLLLAAMREAGLSSSLAPYQCPLSPAWQSMYDRIEGRYQKTALSRFMRYCSRNDIGPGTVTDEVASAYLEALEAESLIKNPRTNHQTVCRVWNLCAGDIEGWSVICLTAPRYEDRLYAISDDLINPALLEVIEGYMAFLAGNDLFDGLPKPFRPASIKAARGNIRRFVSALHHSGADISTISSLEELVRFERFKIGMKWLWERNGNKTSRSIGEIAWTIRCIAVKHLRCDDETAQKYTDALAMLRVQSTGLSPKNRTAMQQFDDTRIPCRFLSHPEALWRLSEKAKGKKAQLLVQIAVATEILIFAPMRIKNLCNLRLDRHFAWIDGRLHINLDPAEVKNDMPLHFVMPNATSNRIQTYIDEWRSLFLPESNPHLFPGRNGKPKDVSALRKQITGYLFEHTGICLTPHQFRHVAAKLLLDARPGHYEVVRKVLGHKNLSTTYEHYAGAETQAAVELYDNVILDIKNGGDGSQRGMRSGKSTGSRDRLSADEELQVLDPLNPFLNGGRR
jgi:hypothetical protein